MLPKAPQLPGLSRRLWMSAAVLGGHWVVIVGAGHGVGPIGLVEIFGRAEEYRSGQIFAWIGAVLLILSVVHRFAFRLLAPLAIIALAISTTLFVRLSEVWPISLATLVPFAGAALFLGRTLLSARPARGEAEGRAGTS